MPYSVRRTFGRRRPRSQIQWAEARISREALAAAARRPAPVRGLVVSDGELKSVDVGATVAADATSSVALLNGMARGDEINERIGREVTMRSIQITGCSYVAPAAGIDQNHRVILVYDRQTNAAALTAAQVLSAVNCYAPRNLENRKRFKILFDRTWHLNATAEPNSQHIFKFYRRLAHPMTFNAGDAGTVADITTGSLYLVAIGSVAPGATAGSVLFNARIRYSDH